MRGKLTLRCEVTGVDLARRDAHVLDTFAATAARRELAQRLALLDRLLRDLGRQPGDRQARTLGPVMARLYSDGAGIPGLFVPMEVMATQVLDRWRAGVTGNPSLAGEFDGLTGQQWVDLHQVSKRLRRGLAPRDAWLLCNLGLDALLANRCPGNGPTSMRDWLAHTAPKELLAACRPGLDGSHPAALEVLGRLCAVAASDLDLALEAADAASGDCVGDVDDTGPDGNGGLGRKPGDG